MKILIACEFSGIVRDAFIKRGHDAMSCDLLPTERPGPHYQGDVFDIIDQGWDMMIAHPPCTFLSNSGVCHLYIDRKKTNGIYKPRWNDMESGAHFFKRLLNANIKKIAIENPVMHGHAKKIVGEQQKQTVQPWQFGHPEKKATCLWLKNLPPLIETNNVKKEMELLPKNKQQRLHYLPPSEDRAKLRSITFSGLADAMATQWS